MNKLILAICVVVCLSIGSYAFSQEPRTPETMALRTWLSTNTQRPAIGAQWNGGVESIGWEEQTRAGGKSPLVFGIEYYDYGLFEKNLEAREKGARFAIEKYSQGGIITICDHMPNFVTGGDAWDRKGDALAAVLPGGKAHSEFIHYLDRLAVFLNSLKVNGKAVPVLFRPLHEMNGAWFWWGDSNSGEQLIRLWQFYHSYLTKEKGVKNALWVWSPNIDRSASVERYMAYWPGAAYVDVVGLDGYDNTEMPNIANETMVRSFNAVTSIARKFSLPVAITEVGAKIGAQEIPGFWDEAVLPALHNQFLGASYVLIWNYEFGPREGTPAAAGFWRMLHSGQVLNLGDVRGEQLYGADSTP